MWRAGPVLETVPAGCHGRSMRRITYIDIDLARPPMVLGCERLPFVVLIGAVVFVLIVLFGGITFHGLIAGLMLIAIGIGVLRRIARYDPYFFAVTWQAMQTPRELPAVPREPMAPMLFVGYDDPPRRRR